MATPTRTEVHRDTARLDIHDLVRTLNEAVGPTVVQTIAGVKDRSMPATWAKPDGPVPRATAQQRLRLGYRVWKTLELAEGASVALAWLMGPNPYLNEDVPLLHIHDLNARAVLSAAEAFIDDRAAA